MAEKNTEKENQNSNKLMVGILVFAAVVLVVLFNKVKQLESGKVAVKGTDTVNEAPAPSEVPSVINVDITQDDPVLGKADAKVTVVEFSDFLCPFCAAHSGINKEMSDSMSSRNPGWEPAISSIKKEYVDTGKVRFVFKDAPYHGEEAVKVHAAARCANDQDKFWQYYELLYSRYSSSKSSFTQDDLLGFAKELGIDNPVFSECVTSGKHDDIMRKSAEYAQSLGVRGTPSTAVNGELLVGALPYSAFKEAIERELAK